MPKKPKNIQVELTLSWTFNEKEWVEEKEHLEECRKNPMIIVGEDLMHTLFMLNELSRPDLKRKKITYVDWRTMV